MRSYLSGSESSIHLLSKIYLAHKQFVCEPFGIYGLFIFGLEYLSKIFAVNNKMERRAVMLKIIYLEYLLCGIGMLLLNKAFKVKASGHACGIVGPMLLFIYFGLYIPAIVGTVLVLPVYISSVRTKQHTLPQLIGGSAIPAVVLLMIVFFMAVLMN